MANDLNYASPVTRNRGLIVYLLLVLPSLLMILSRMLCEWAPDFIVSNFVHPVDMIDYAHHLFPLQRRFERAFFNGVFLGGVLMLLITASLFIPRVRRWLDSRAPLWILVLIPDWIVLCYFVFTPIIR
jgi:hypothetical protein